MGKVIESKQKYIVLGALFITWVVCYLDKLSMNVAIIPIAEEFKLNETQSGLIISAFFLSYAVMQLVGGFLSDKYGARKVILFSVILWSILTVATGFAWSFISLIVIRILFGLGQGSFPAASSVAIADNFPKTERGRAKSILTAAITIGAMISSLIAATFITHLGWRILFFFFGGLGLFITLVLFFVLNPNSSSEKGAMKVPIKQLLKKRLVWQLLVMNFSVSIVNWGLTTWMPTYMVKERHLDLISMGVLAIIPALVALLSTLTTGWLIDKLRKGKEKILIIIGSIIVAVSLFSLANVYSIVTVVVFQSVTYIGLMLATTTIVTMPLKYLPNEMIGTSVGLINFGSQMAGALSPALIGFIITLFNGSYIGVFIFLTAIVLIPIITALKLHSGIRLAEVGDA
ncbi:MFS transporter [Bacillus toyonensis]|uniref:MFS transporter n=1 Tax=Bacillus toyonensis TaxID=155322 RepID=UPI000BF06D95|nr:MFS transporter [Bacillus toyonensis]MCG3797209.1 MFS transporter [Bacillus toyonensis]MED2617433.1 MFS transporter [Bacillus toyonensis]PEL65392.1 MFS transporter [Bacillus toyonensis]PHB83358.1 MFS transporter [Bacillus toyonensis]